MNNWNLLDTPKPHGKLTIHKSEQILCAIVKYALTLITGWLVGYLHCYLALGG